MKRKNPMLRKKLWKKCIYSRRSHCHRHNLRFGLLGGGRTNDKGNMNQEIVAVL